MLRARIVPLQRYESNATSGRHTLFAGQGLDEQGFCKINNMPISKCNVSEIKHIHIYNRFVNKKRDEHVQSDQFAPSKKK